MILSDQPASSVTTNHVNTISAEDQRVSFARDGLTLQIKKPAKWESFPTEYGIVIGESFGSVATAGVLKGVMTYTFVTPVTDFIIPAQTGSNIAQTILNEILADPTYTTGIAYQPAVGFTWNHYDAAYYLLSGEDHNATIVIGITIPDLKTLLSCSVSAPYEQRNRIRDLLPTLLDGIVLNDITFAGGDLAQLPDPLLFPEYQSPSTLADTPPAGS